MRIEWKPRRLEIFVIGTLIIGLFFVVIFAFSRARNIKRGVWCQSNLKKVALATMQYTRDYDEIYPLARNWSESLYPYCKDKTLFHCPAVPQHGYSMNQTLAVAAMSRINDVDEMPLVFESSVLKPFQCDNGKTFLREPRHNQGIALVYADGHAEWREVPPPFPKIAPPPNKLPPIIIQKPTKPLP